MAVSREEKELEQVLRDAERRNDIQALRDAVDASISAACWRPLDSLLNRLDRAREPSEEQQRLKLRVTNGLAGLTRSRECSCIGDTEDGQPWRDCGLCAGSGKVPPRDPPPNPVLRWLQYAANLMGVQEAEDALRAHWNASASFDQQMADRLWRLLTRERLTTMEARKLTWRGWALIKADGQVELGPVAPPLPELG